MPNAVQVRRFSSTMRPRSANASRTLTRASKRSMPSKTVSGVGNPGPGVHDVRHRQVVAQPDLEVVGIVGRGDFDRAGAEFGVDVFVGDDDQLSIEERMLQRRRPAR